MVPGFAFWHPVSSFMGELLSCLPLLQPLLRSSHQWAVSWWMCRWLPFPLQFQVYHAAQPLWASTALCRHTDKAALCSDDVMVKNVTRKQVPKNPATAMYSREREQTQIHHWGQGHCTKCDFEGSGKSWEPRQGHCGVSTCFVKEKEPNPIPQQQTPWEHGGDCSLSPHLQTQTHCPPAWKQAKIHRIPKIGTWTHLPSQPPLWSASAPGQDCLDSIAGWCEHARLTFENVLSTLISGT